MAPAKPRRKSGAAAKDFPVKEEQDVKAMPPPPAPPLKILEAEMNALSTCLRNAVVKTGQIYAFYSDTHKLGIQNHASNPPRSLTADLGREIEQYDRLCDTIEARLLRAIAVLQRDQDREDQRIRDAEQAAIANRTRSKSTSLSPTSSRVPLPGLTSSPTQMSSGELPLPTPSSSPLTRAGSNLPPGRRPSAISISSLHRPTFPLKLDLSASSLRMPVDESFLASGLHSPVTLAPKSARPLDYPADLMAALASADASTRVDVDLTLPESNYTDPPMSGSAEKPIELDLESMDIDMAMNDLFGDSADDGEGDGLFSPVVDDSTKADPPAKDDRNGFLNALGLGDVNNDDLFGSLNVDSSGHLQPGPSTGSTAAAPSPGTLLASFASSSQFNPDDPSSGLPEGQAFDLDGLDFPNFMADDHQMMDHFLSLHTEDPSGSS
ncbi:hypothetical protein C8J56DRAFT_918378 [Mycena floridula]|nr:hypothetical protein C8J56DRAFT_918378 [Mycena floridula]